MHNDYTTMEQNPINYAGIYRRELADLDNAMYRKDLRIMLGSFAWLDRHPTLFKLLLAGMSAAAIWHVFIYA